MKSLRLKMRHITSACLVALASFSIASIAVGQTNSEAKKGGGTKKSTSINFEDQLVEGQAQKPELFYMLQKTKFNHKRLIRLRDDFLPEMRKTSEDVNRKGSGT